MHNGAIFWEGRSPANQRQIVAIATGLVRQSLNDKTGDMIQTWILDALASPTDASKQKLDSSVCWGCPQKRSEGGACYVTLHQAPSAVYQAYLRGSYPRVSPRELGWLVEGEKVRMGSYGDPVVVPRSVWTDVLRQSAGWTGYTHSWMKERAQGYKDILMASVDTSAQRAIAQAAGWRTFRVTKGAPEEGEIRCPASDEMNHSRTCATCGACDGAGRGAGASRASVVIKVHGALASRWWEPTGTWAMMGGANA